MEKSLQEELIQEMKDLDDHISILVQQQLDLQTKYTELFKPSKNESKPNDFTLTVGDEI